MIAGEKAAARKSAFAARKAAHGQGLDAAANARLLAALADLAPTVISAYMPIQTEISPIATMTTLHEQGHQICVPVIQGNGKPLAFHHWTPDSEMVDGPFKARVPKDGQVLVPHVVITPLVGFDARGCRLGYGGGFYDRSFEEIGKQHAVRAIGFAYSAQELPLVPTEPTDHRLDMMVTENGCLSFG